MYGKKPAAGKKRTSSAPEMNPAPMTEPVSAAPAFTALAAEKRAFFMVLLYSARAAGIPLCKRCMKSRTTAAASIDKPRPSCYNMAV